VSPGVVDDITLHSDYLQYRYGFE